MLHPRVLFLRWWVSLYGEVESQRFEVTDYHLGMRAGWLYQRTTVGNCWKVVSVVTRVSPSSSL